MNTEQAILEKIRALPIEKQQEVLDFVEFLHQKQTARNPVSVSFSEPIDRKREMEWLNENRKNFVGEWVALDGDRLLSHGANAKEVYEMARQAGVEIPFMAHIEPLDQLPFGGW
ncbi:MAG: DUF2281 domain-containing protein [Acidobacteriota bacterium]